MRAPPPQKRDSMAGGCLHYQLYEPPRHRAAAVMFLVRRRALFSDPVNMNKLALFCVTLLNFSFLGYYIRDRSAAEEDAFFCWTVDVLFLA